MIDTSKNIKNKNSRIPNYEISIWIAIGLGFGMMFGMLFNNLAIGVAIGLLFGISVYFSQQKSSK